MTSDVDVSEDEAISVLFNSWRSDEEDEDQEIDTQHNPHEAVLPTTTVPAATSTTGGSRKREPVIDLVRHEFEVQRKPYPAPTQLGSRPLSKFEAEESLQRLRKRYRHVVPPSTPRLRKRNRPLCLFINYLGTRLPPPMEPSSQPTDPPSCSAYATTTQLPRSKKRKLSVSGSSRPADYPDFSYGTSQESCAHTEVPRHGRSEEPTAYPTEPMGRMMAH